MTKNTRNHVDDLRGASRLAVEATKGVTDLVETVHRRIGGGPPLLGSPFEGVVRMFTAPVYQGIRAVTGLVGGAIELALTELEPWLGRSAPGFEREALLSAMNGVVGDYLAESGNPLAIELGFRRGGIPLSADTAELRDALPEATGKLLVMVHGSCMNDLMWQRKGHDHGAALERELGMTAVYLRYNSGLHISMNGRAFAEQLEQLVAAWPVPVEEITVLAHSMGGLVTRGACHYAEEAGYAWRAKLRRIFFLGTPHHGAPLERGGNWIDMLLTVSSYSAPFARLAHIRSAGVTDLRYGNVLDEDWNTHDRFEGAGDLRGALALPAGVDCYAIAGTTAAAEAAGRLPGDLLVPLASALGKCEREGFSLGFPEENQYITFATAHLDLLDRLDVYERIRSWLTPAEEEPVAPLARSGTED